MPKVRGFLKLPLVLLCMNSAAAQTFQKLYSQAAYNDGKVFYELADSGHYLLNLSQTNTANNFNILKTNLFGDSISSSSFSIPKHTSLVFGYCYNSKNEICISGCKNWYPTYNVNIDTLRIYRYNFNGSLKSSWVYPDTLALQGLSILKTRDNGFIIGSGIEGTYGALNKIFLLKLDSLGNILWKKFILPHSDILIMNDIVESDNGSFVAKISEYGGGNSPRAGFKLVKFDALGNIIWSSSVVYGILGININQIKAVSGGFYMLLQDEDSQTSLDFTVLYFIDSTGVLQWSKSFNNPHTFYSTVETNKYTGDIFLCGGTRNSPNSSISTDILITKLNQNHDSITSFIYGFTARHDIISYSSQLKNGSIGIIGSSGVPPLIGDTKALFIVIDSLGNMLTSTKARINENIKLISVYPNPSNGIFTLQSIDTENTRILLTDIRGREIDTFYSVKGSFSLGAQLSSGIYFLTISSPQQTQIIKLIKTN
ncbi:MAG: T9SS type A sorting domain-containing protein [Bacteroidetes bacterium]|nr:T9SS type A sorting domain-containing protein [Bacteroidota bacterium]